MPSSTIHPEPGLELIPGYRLRAILGKGGYGEVWDAVGPNNVAVALKLVPLAEQLAEPDLRSLQMLPVLRHPSLLEVYGFHVAGGRLILVMERGHGTLADLLRETMTSHKAALPRADVLGWMAQIACGLDYLNEAGTTLDGIAKPSIIHRDIKPQNIFLVGTGVKIGDFGLARVLENAATSPHSGAMTPAFAPPEFFCGQTTRTSDQYSLAVMYVQLVGGKLPFVGSPAEVMRGHTDKAPDLSMLPENDRNVVGRALAKDPGRRWPTCEAFVSALFQVGSGKSFGPEVGYSTEDFDIELPSENSYQATVREPLPYGPTHPAEVTTRIYVGPEKPASRWPKRIAVLVSLVLVGVLGAGGVWWATRSADADEPINTSPSARVEVVSVTERVVVEAGQSAKVHFTVRRLEPGQVRLRFADLPPGVRADEVQLGEGESEATFSLQVEATAADGRRWATLHATEEVGRVEVVVYRDLAATLKRLREELARPATRDRAAGDLSELGPRATPACPELVACLNEYGVGVPCPPADALVAIGVGSAPSLAEALGQKNLRSDHAIDALVRIGPSATSAILNVAKSGPGEQKRDAATALGRMPVVPSAALDFLVGCLADPASASAAGMSLVRMAGPGLAPLLEAFERDAARRETLGTALGSARGASAKAVCDAMVHLLDAKNADVRRGACRVLGRLGNGAQNATDRLGQALEEADARTKIEAAFALWSVSGDPKGTETLIELLGHTDATTQRQAHDALAEMDPTPNTLKALQDGLKSTESATRHNAVRALGTIGPNSREAAATLAELLVTHLESNDDETNLLFDALANIGPGSRAAEPKLIGMLETGDRSLRAKAAKTLGRIAPLSRPVEAALNKATSDSAQNVAAAAVAALRENQPGTPPKQPPGTGGPELRDRAQSRDLDTRRKALESLAAMGSSGAFALPAVTQSLRHAEPSIRLAACRALWRIDRRAAALEGLVELALAPGDEVIRRAAFDTLGEIGPDAVSISPKLLPLLEVDDAVRGKAALALYRIETNKAALTTLSGMLRSRRTSDRLEAATACVALGKAVPDRLRNFLTPRLDDRDRLTRTRAIEAMTALDPTEARKRLGL